MTSLALEVKGLTKSFGGLKVTQDVSLAVAPGERRLIIGPNGAGKTTLFNQITGEIAPDAGTIHLMGRNITRVASRRRAHLGLSRTYQIITLFPDDTILRNVTLALLGLSSVRWNPLRPLDDFGHLGQSWRETDVKDTDLEAVITDLLEGQYNNPVRVVGFNTAQGWAKDVSEEVANELRHRCDLQMTEVPPNLQEFVERHENRERTQLSLRL